MESPYKKYVKALVNLGVAGVVLVLAVFLLPKTLVYFLPFVVGWIIALIAGPLVRFFEEKVKIKRKAGSAFVIIVVIGIVVLAGYLIGAKLVEEVIGLANSLPEMWDSMEKDFDEIGQNLSIIYERFPSNIKVTINNMGDQASKYIGELLSRLSSPTIAAVGNFAKQLPAFIIGIIMCLLSSYFFVAERAQINQFFCNYTPASIQSRYGMMKRSLVKAVGGYFKAQLKIEIWMYLLLLVGFSLLKVNYAFLIALGIAFLDLLPFFGTGTVMVPWAIVKILSADYKMAVWLLIIWGVGQLARQVIQPKIVGDSIGVPPIPTLFLLFIGYKVGGVFGMIFAVPIGLILFTMYEEGAFNTTKDSIHILVAGLNRFRMLKPQDMEGAEEMNRKKDQNPETESGNRKEQNQEIEKNRIRK